MAVENEKNLGTMLLFSFFLLDVDDDFFVPKKTTTTTTTTTKTENIHFQRWTDGFENFFCGEVEGGGGSDESYQEL